MSNDEGLDGESRFEIRDSLGSAIILVAPSGILSAGGRTRLWRAGRLCLALTLQHVTDVTITAPGQPPIRALGSAPPLHKMLRSGVVAPPHLV
jgi:hypothetical protein